MKTATIDTSSVPSTWRVVDHIRLPITVAGYFRKNDRILAKHPTARSFPGGTATIFAIPVT